MFHNKIYLISISNGNNFNKSFKYGIWGFSSNHKDLTKGDILLFYKKKEEGVNKVIGFATFNSHLNKKIDNDKLNWEGYEKFPYQIKYEDFRELHDVEFIVDCHRISYREYTKNHIITYKKNIIKDLISFIEETYLC
jgi:hypothetical protein